MRKMSGKACPPDKMDKMMNKTKAMKEETLPDYFQKRMKKKGK